jgi:methylphosphotriester-DNA--protein-cysteine methyltransferase
MRARMESPLPGVLPPVWALTYVSVGNQRAEPHPALPATGGTTPMQQMLRLRIQRAQELLETTDIPIAHVSDHVGFGSSVGFRQQFTRARGHAPQRYRAAFRATELSSATS